MASKKQKEANRLNAAKSRGPRSPAGKKRASRNSYRHGLATSYPSGAERAREVEKLARKIAGNTEDSIVLEHARAAAHAELDLIQIGRVKIATIERYLSAGQAAPATPSEHSDRTAEAVRQALPELIKLDRYARRAAFRREQALGAFSKSAILDSGDQ
jgi:hypothetical protein